MNSPGKTRRKFLEVGAGAAWLAQKESGAATGGRQAYGVFSEGRIGKLRLKNRLVRAATAEGACPNEVMTEAGLEIFRALARGGVGLIITGHMTVAPGGRAEGTQTCIYDDRFTGPLRRVVEVAREAGDGCRVVAQISHAGMQSQIVEPVGPTERPWPKAKNRPRALATGEVERIVKQFAQAARRAKEAGFDGVEIHAAHGYLLSSFLSPYTNTRTDKYGGSLEGRVRIIREIVEQARGLTGSEFLILIKMNCEDGVEGGIDIGSFPALAKEMEKTGVNAVEVSGSGAAREVSGAAHESYFLKHAQRLQLDVPVILTGGNRSVERLERIFKTGKPDFFGLARPLVREPDLPARWREGPGGEESACISCNRCLRALGKGEATRCRVEEAEG